MYEAAEGDTPEEKINSLRRLQHRVTKDHTISKIGKSFEVLDHIDKNGKVDKRRFYDKNGIMRLDIHTICHGDNDKYHSFGKNIEHVHEFIFNDDGTKLLKKISRDLIKERGYIMIMTIKDLKASLNDWSLDYSFEYKDKACGFEILDADQNHVNYLLWFGKASREYTNKDDMLNDPLFDGKSLVELLPFIDIEVY